MLLAYTSIYIHVPTPTYTPECINTIKREIKIFVKRKEEGRGKTRMEKMRRKKLTKGCKVLFLRCGHST